MIEYPEHEGCHLIRLDEGKVLLTYRMEGRRWGEVFDDWPTNAQITQTKRNMRRSIDAGRVWNRRGKPAYEAWRRSVA